MELYTVTTILNNPDGKDLSFQRWINLIFSEAEIIYKDEAKASGIGEVKVIPDTKLQTVESKDWAVQMTKQEGYVVLCSSCGYANSAMLGKCSDCGTDMV